MKNYMINLNKIDSVKKFVNIVQKYNVDVDLCSGRYTVDAKSILGIFSLDLSKPIEMNINTDNVELLSCIEDDLKEFFN